MNNLGDFDTSAVIYGKFATYRPSTGATFTLAGSPALSVYKDNSTTQSTTGVTLTADFDSVTGLNHFAVDTSADGTFYSAGSFFDIVITTGTVDSVSVTGSVVGSFTIRKNSSLKPATAGRTLVVDASGLADANAVKLGPTGSGTAQTARDIGASVLLSTGTGTGQLDFTSGVVKANATQWLGGTIPAVNVTGVPLVDLKYTLGTISPATAGSVRADSVTGAVGSVTGAVGSVTGNVGGNVTGSVGSVTGLTASDVGTIKGVTDKLTTTLEDAGHSPGEYRFSTTALSLAPSSGSAPSAATVAAAVWDLSRSGHSTAGTFGEGVASVQGNVTGSVASVSGAVGSVSGLTAADVGAIKAKTDSLTFTVSGQVDSNVQYVNDTQVTGDGHSGTEWGPA